ncbi:MAG: dienelactone hydrolase family protein [Thermodesulfobacteriota bacterium]
MYEGLIAETVGFYGHNGDAIEGYLARPLGTGPFPGVMVIHHMPGWDEATKEITRKFAFHGYAAFCPHLHHREGPGTPEEIMAKVWKAGLVPDERFLGDLEAALRYLELQPFYNGKVGIIGYCSGGRQVYLAACTIPRLNAAVDCYGGRVVAKPEELTERQPVAPIDLTKDLACPLLGLFGAEDKNPAPEHVQRMEEELKRYNKTYEFHTYENAGHAFFSVDRPSYRVEAAVDGWKKIFAFYEKYLKTP